MQAENLMQVRTCEIWWKIENI